MLVWTGDGGKADSGQFLPVALLNRTGDKSPESDSQFGRWRRAAGPIRAVLATGRIAKVPMIAGWTGEDGGVD
jgi:hypothetical protein